MRFHTQTAGVSLTAQQPEVNIVRTALQALAAVLGGTQSLHTNSFDEALALPTEDAVRIALRTQQVIAHETGVVNTIDPLGGSYYLEELTNRLEAEAYDYFSRIEKLGGVIPAIEENFQQREIAEASFRYQAEVESKQRVVVGVNRYQLEQEAEIELLRVDPALEQQQIERVQGVRARRDSAAAERSLAALKEASLREDANLMPLLIEASRAYVTMGEMCDALRETVGHVARDARFSNFDGYSERRTALTPMNSVATTFSSPRFQRYLLWFGVAVLAVGAAALVFQLIGGSDKTRVKPDKGFHPTVPAKASVAQRARAC